MSRVVGVMQVRNEWPVCAISITYALTHVEELVVIDSGSNLLTRQGLTALCEQFAGRLRWYASSAPTFDQEAAAFAAANLVARDDSDWIYHIDADEFILVPEGRSLLEILESSGSDVVQYEVHNWISMRHFDVNQPEAYLALRTRSLPTRTLPLSDEDFEGLRSGALNYFDVHFLSKVMMRWGVARIVTEGGHLARDADAQHALPAETLRVAHVPLLARSRLAARVAVGTPLLEVATRRSWQSRLVAEFEQRGEIDEFWRRHSLGDGDAPECATVIDESLVRAISPFVASVQLDVSTVTPSPSTESFAASVSAVRYLLDRDSRLSQQLQRSERLRDDLQRTVTHQRQERQALEASVTWRILSRVARLTSIFRRGR